VDKILKKRIKRIGSSLFLMSICKSNECGCMFVSVYGSKDGSMTCAPHAAVDCTESAKGQIRRSDCMSRSTVVCLCAIGGSRRV